MNHSTTQETNIIAILNGEPNGLNADVLADRLNLKPATISSRLSKMFAYGKLARARTPTSRGTMETIWKVPQ